MTALYTDDLVSTIQRDSFLTTAQGNFSPDTLLGIAQDHLEATLMPILLSLRDGWFRVATGSTMDPDIAFVASQSDYTLPTYAMYGGLESVQYISSSSSQLRPDQLTRIEIENLGLILPSTTSGTPCYFSVNSTAITVYPTPTTSVDAMRVWYDRRPGKMVMKAEAGQVASVTSIPGSGIVTFVGSTLPLTFGSSTACDFYSGQSPYQLKAQLTTTAAVSGVSVTFNQAALTASGLAPGDWVCLRDQTVFLPVPQELKSFLSDLVIASLARTQQDANLYQAQVQIISGKAKQVLSSTGNRLPGNPKKIRMTNPLVRNRSWSGYR